MSGILVATGIGALTTIYSVDQARKANKKGVEAGLSAAEMERQTATDTLNYYRERDSQSFALQAAANAIAGQVANSQVALMDQQRQISGELHTRTKDVFWPLEDQIIKEAKEYDTPERQEREAGKAMADVESQLSLQRQASNRGLMRLGVNPNSAKFGLEQNMMSLGEGSAKAAAGNAARSNIEATGWARRFDAAGLGRNLPTTQVAAANSATAAGNGAMNAAYAPVNAANTQTQLMGGALSQYGVGMSNANRLITQSYGNQADMWGGAASGLASLSGSLMGRYTANNQGSGSSGLTNFGNTSSGSSSVLGAPATQSYNDLYLA